MATTLYLTSTASPLGGSGKYALSTARGSSSTSAITNTTASGTSIPATATAGGTALTWWYQVGAGTISGNVSANIRGKESNTSANAGAGIVIDLYQSDGTTLIGNLLTATAPATITEYSTTDAAKALASTALTSRTATNGCWIKVTLTVRNVGTMASGYTVTNTYNGPTAGSAGDTYVTFATSLPAYIIPGVPYVAAAGTAVSGGSSLSVPVPSGVVAGDLIVMALGGEWNSTTLPTSTSVSSSGFTVAQVAAFQSYPDYAEANFLLYKYATGADSGNYSVTFNSVNGGAPDAVAGAASIVRGGPTSGNPFSDAFQSSHSVGSASVSVSTFTPTAANSLLIGSVWCNDGVTVSTYPSAWVQQTNVTSGNGLMLTTLQQATAAATGTLTWGMASGSPDPVVLIGTIRPPIAPTTLAPSSFSFYKNVPFSQTLTTDGSPTPTFSVTSGTLPTGITLSAGVLSGTPTDASGTSYSFTITATNSGGSKSQAYSGTIISYTPPTPQIALNFDEGSGSTIHDYSGNGYDFTLTDTTRWSTSGKTSGGLGYGAGTSYPSRMLTDNLANGGAFTVMMWIYMNSTGDGGLLGNNSLDLQVIGGGYINGDGFGSTPSTYPANTWIHVAWVADGTHRYIYINGSVATTVTGAAPGGWPNGATIGIGGSNDTSMFDGVIDDLRVFTAAVTATDIAYFMSTPVSSAASTPSITTTTLNTLQAGTVFSQVLAATGTSPITWAVTGGTLPAGLVLSSSGTLSGTPSSAGSYDFTVTATNSAGSNTQEYTGTISKASRLVRNKTVYQTSGTTITATFDETTVLDSTYLLVAVVQVASTTTVSAPSGWTEITGGGNNSTNQVRTFVKQGNGSTNSITVTVPSASTTVVLSAYSGFSSLTPIATDGGSSYTSATGQTGNALPAGSYNGYGVMIQVFGVGGTVTWGSWTNATAVGATTGSSALANANQRLSVSYTEFDGSVTTPAATISWSPSQTSREMAMILPLTNAVPVETIALSFDENSGSTAYDSSGNDNDAIVNHWGTGHTNAGVVSGSSDVGAHRSGDPVSGTTSLSWGAWFKAPSIAEMSILFAVPASGPGWNAVWLGDDGSVVGSLLDSSGSTIMQAGSPAGLVSPGMWYHVFFVVDYSVGLGSVYLNGALVGTANISGTPTSLSILEIAGEDYDDIYMDGFTVDDVRVFAGVALTQWQITQLASTPVSPQALPAPVAAWNFDEGSGATSIDQTGNGHTINVNAWATGHTNTGAQGDSSHRAAGYTGTLLTTPTQLTVMGWVKPVTPSGSPDMITLRESSGATYTGFYWVSSTQGKLYVQDSAGYSESSTITVSTGTWSHVAIVANATSVALYLNGSSVATLSRSGTFGNFTVLNFGGDSSFAGGIYDDCRIFATALSAAQVVTAMNTPVATNATPAITTVTLHGVYSGTAFSQTLAATNSPTSWAVSSGTLPAGLTLNTSTGVITGNPSGAPGTTFDFFITATNSSATSTPVEYSGTITVMPSAIVEWAADEGTGASTTDTSGNGHTGTAQSDGWVSGHGTHAYAAAGNATNPAVMLEGTTLFSSSKTATLMCWVDAITLTGSGDLIEIKSAHTNGAALTIYRPTSTSLQTWFNDTAGTTTETTPYPVTTTGQWNHIACVLTATTLSLYLNGVLVESTSVTSGSGDLGAIQLFYAGGTDSKFNQGAVNDVRLFDTALTVNDISYFMDTPATHSSALPLAVAAYNFNEGTGASAVDATGNGHTLTISSGQATWTTSGHASSALMGNGGTGAVNTSFANPSVVTMMGWVKPVTVSGGEVALFGFWSPSGDPNDSSQFVLYATRSAFGTSNHLVGNFRIGGTLAEIVGPTLIAGTWVHVALTYDGSSTVSLYLNGALYTTVSASGALGTGYFSAAARSDATVDDIRIFNQALTQPQISAYMYAPVGTPASLYTDHTVFENTTPSGASLGSYSDAGTGDWIGTQFYMTATPARAWRVVGTRIYVPTGSSLIGLTGYIGLQRRDDGDGGIFGGSGSEDGTTGSYPNGWETNGAKTPMWRPLVAGWNEFYFAQTWTANSLDGLMVGYSIGGGSYYLFDSSTTSDYIQALDGTNLYFSEMDGGAGGAGRSFYSTNGGTTRTTSRWYGLDIIVREEVLPSPLLAYSFEEGTGATTADISTNGHTGTVADWSTGHTGHGGVGDSSHSAVHYAGTVISSPTAFTFMHWFLPTSSVQYASINWLTDNSGGGGSSSSGNWVSVYWADSSHLALGVRTSSGLVDITASTQTLTNAWVHVAVTWDGSTATFYLDGVAVGSTAAASTVSAVAWTEAGGAMNSDFHNYNVGIVDDVRLFNTALTPDLIGIFMSTPVTNTVSLPAPIVAYNFDEGAGTIARDWSGNNLNATVTGWAAGHTSSGVTGTSSHSAARVTQTLISSVSALTVMAWVNPSSSFNDLDPLVVGANLSGAASNKVGIGYSTVYPSAWVQNSSGTTVNATGSTALSSGTWYHLATVLDASTVSLYVNGVLTASQSWSGTVSTIGAMEIGGIEAWGEYNAGVIDDVRLFNVALTAAQINAFMAMPVQGWAPLWLTKISSGLVTVFPYFLGTGGIQALGEAHAPAANLLAAYSFSETSGTTAADLSGNGRTLTVRSSSHTTSGHTGEGVVGNSSALDITTSSATIPAGLSQLTMMAWVQISDGSNGGIHIVRIGTPSNSYGMGLWLSSIYPRVPIWTTSSGSQIGAAQYVAHDTDWHHIAVVWSTTADPIVYIDGVAGGVGMDSSSGTARLLPDQTELWVGVDHTNDTSGITIDDVRIFGTGLSAADITLWMNTPL